WTGRRARLGRSRGWRSGPRASPGSWSRVTLVRARVGVALADDPADLAAGEAVVAGGTPGPPGLRWGVPGPDLHVVVVGATALGHVTVHGRSEEHTSELQSRENLVCRLLLEKKKEGEITAS